MTKIGRTAQPQIPLSSPGGLARNHAVFEQNGFQWSLRDLGSANGSFLSGVRYAAPVTDGRCLVAISYRLGGVGLACDEAEKQSPMPRRPTST
ncbi:MAG TPA: FHA domain-containing protein [Silvibacterium sp.]|nr:FHA domain-containing protein [Silvibacterium sp.]